MTATAESPVLYARDGRVATLTLNRPGSLNSLDLATVEALMSGVARAVGEDAAVLVLTGTGRAFCSGADLGAALGHRDAQGRVDIGTPMRSHYNALVAALSTLAMPLVVAVNGVAAGGGASLALLGDVVIAARSAVFRQTFVDIGLMPDMGATWLLPRLIGRARARGMALLGEAIDAQTAKDWGLIWAVAEDGELMQAAGKIAARLAGLSRTALNATRHALDAGERNTLAGQLEYEAQAQAEQGRQDAFTQAVTAFLSRRGQTPRGAGS